MVSENDAFTGITFPYVFLLTFFTDLVKLAHEVLREKLKLLYQLFIHCISNNIFY